MVSSLLVVSPRTPESAASSRPESLPFGLSFVDGRGVLTLAGRKGPGPIAIDVLEMEIPGLRFPFDLSGGVSTFRHRRCALQQATLSIAEGEARRWLQLRAGRGELGYRNTTVRLGAGFVELQGQVVFADQTSELLFRGFLRPASSVGHALELCLCDLRVYGPCSVPAPLLAAGLLQALGAGTEPAAAARLLGCTDALLDPLALTLRQTLPRSGWRLPGTQGTRLTWILVQPERIQLAFGPGAFHDQAAPSPRLQRLRAVQEAKARHRSLEELGLTAGPRTMLEQYRQRLQAEAGVPFVAERVIQLLAAEPESGDETLALCQVLRASQPAHPSALLAEAAVHTRRGDGLAAAAAYRELAVQARAEGDQAEELLASLCAGRAALHADRQRARLDFERVLELDRENDAALAHLVPLYAEAGEWGLLVELRRRQLVRASGEQRIHAHLGLGELYRARLADPARAREHYEQALELDPTCEPALRGLAEACIDGDDLLTAVAALDRLAAMESERLEVDEEVATHLRIASLWEHLGDSDRARARLERALALRPANPQALQRAAGALIAAGEQRQAAELLQRLLTTLQDPGARTDVHRQLAELRLAGGELEAAREQLEAALALDSEDVPALRKLLAVVERAGDPGGIASALRRLARVERDPAARSALHLRRGCLLAELGEGEEAELALEAACAHAEDGGYAALRELARLRSRADDPEGAGQAWRRVLGTERGASDPEAWAQLARAEVALGALAQGEAAAVRALELEPPPVARTIALDVRVTSARASGDAQRLRAALEARLAAPLDGPERATLLVELGEVRLELDDLDAAAAAFAEALALRDDPAIRERYGLVQERREAWEDARGALEAVLEALAGEPEHAPRRAELAHRLGAIAERQARPREAIELYRRALGEGLAGAAAERAWDRIIELHLERGDPAAAARAAQAAAASAPKGRAADWLCRAGQLWLKRAEQRELARDCFREALALQLHPAALDALESIYSESQDHAALIEILQLKAELSVKRPAIQKALFARLGETLEALGRLEEARTAYTGALSLDADYLPALRYLAAEAHASGELERAEIYDRRILASALRPESELGALERTELQVQIHLRLAELARLRRQPREEEGQLELALSLDPRNAPALEHLDALLEATRRPAEQLEVLRRRIEVAPDLDQVVALELRRAALLEALPARREEAAAVYRQILLLSPGQELALQRLTPLLHEAGRTAELVEVLEQRAALEEAHRPAAAVELWLQAARACRGTMPERATTCYRRALRLQPDQVEALEELLELLDAQTGPDEVEALLERLVPLCDPVDRPGHEERLAELHAARGEREAARELLRRAVDEGRASLAMRVRLAGLETELGSSRQAAELWGQAAVLARDAGDRERETLACRSLVALASEIGESHVEPACRRLLELEASDRRALAVLANLLQFREEWRELCAVLSRQREAEDSAFAPPEERLATLSRLALAHDRCGHRAEAARLLSEVAFPLARPLGEAQLWPLAGLARDLELDDVELACLRALEAFAQNNPELQLRAAELAGRLGDRKASLAALTLALAQLPPGPQRAATARRILAEQGSDSAADDTTREALGVLLAEDASDDERLRLARLLERRGEPREALEVVSSALALPEARELRWRLLERKGELRVLGDELAHAASAAPSPEEAARLHCRRAALAARTGDAESAERAYLAALERVPDWVEASFALRALYLERKDGERLAAHLLRESERENDLDRRVGKLLEGARLIRTSLHTLEPALALVRRARELRPREPRALALSADLNQELSRLEAAEQDLVALAELNPEGAAELLERAASLARLRADPSAEARHLAQRVGARGLDAALLTRLVTAHRAAGDERGLRALLEQHAGRSPDALLELARIEAGHGDRSAALEAYRRLLERQPDHREALEAAVALSREAGDRPGALRHLRALRDLQPPGPRLLELAREVATLEEELGHLEDAARSWRAAFAQAPAEPELLIRLAGSLIRLEAWQDAAELLEECLASEQCALAGDARVRVAVMLGEIYLDRLDDPRCGASWLRHACELQPHEDGAFRRLLAHHLERQEPVEASELLVLRIAKLAPPERAPLELELGYLLEELRDLSGAARAYAAAYRDAPDLDPSCAGHAHDLYQRAGHYDDALEILGLAIARTDESSRPPLLALRARTLLLKGQVAEAITTYERALERGPDLHIARAELGRLLFERGRFEEALPHLQRAGTNLPDLREAASCSSLAARTLEKLGLADEAIGWYERAIARDPTARAPYEALVPLLEERGSWERLAATLAALVSLTVDPGARTALLARLGSVQRRLGQADAAEASFRSVVEHDPTQTEALAALRQLAGENADWARCAELLERELEHTRDPSRRAQLHRELGQLAADPLADPERAIRNLRVALETDPGDTLAAGLLLPLLESAGHTLEAARLARASAQHCDDHATRRQLLEQAVSGLEAAGENAEAEAARRELSRITAPFPPVPPTPAPALEPAEAAAPLGASALELALESDDPWAIAQACRQRAANPELPPGERAELLIAAARTFEEKLARTLEALLLYEEAALVAPDYLPAIESLADAAYRNQDWHRARDLYDRLWEEEELREQTEIAYRRALVYETLGDETTADQCYERTVALSPTHRPALEGRARLALFRDDVKVAIDSLTALERLVSVDEIEVRSGIRQQLGKLHLREGNLLAAREYLEAAIALDSKRVKALQTLLSVLQALGDFEAMLDVLQQLLCLTTDPLVRASLLHHRAEILGGQLDDEAAAVDNLLRAYDLAPDYPPTLWRLVDYYWEQGDLESVAEMGDHLVAAGAVDHDAPDLRHLRVSVSQLLLREYDGAAALLLHHVLEQGELLGLALADLCQSLVDGTLEAARVAEVIHRSEGDESVRIVAALRPLAESAHGHSAAARALLDALERIAAPVSP
jgi:tetratricopeptide (TPR) repeat protein